MLFVPNVIGVECLYDNFGSSYTEAGLGTQLIADALAHTKSATVELISAATMTRDCYGIGIVGVNGSFNGGARRYLVDLMVDPAGGTAWQVLIPNILFNGPGFGMFTYYFPLRIKAGSSVGARIQCNVGGEDMRLGVQLYGSLSHPEALKFGTFVETIGANEANTDGVAITAGNDVMGSWTQIGTTVRDLWFWQCGGLASGEDAQNNQIIFQDVAVGDVNNKYIVLSKCCQRRTSAEQCDKDACGIGIPLKDVAGGSTVYSRASSSAPDGGDSTIVYGIG